MSSADAIATVTRDGKPAALKALVLVLFFGPLAFFLGDRIAAVLGTSIPVAQGIGAIVPTVVVAGIAYHFGGSGPVSFYEDRIETEHRTVPYADVAVAVRDDQLFGTATFDLFVPDGASLTLRYVTDPDTVSRLLSEQVPAPTDQMAQATEQNTATSGPEYIDSGWRFWDYWRADAALPDTAVVSRADLTGVMDVSAVTVDRIDSVDMRDADQLSDIEKDDVTASSPSS